ncbi:MAG: DUF1508 domain-containing protein [Halobacteriales archaeon]|nr:DUF1508 domain-containing protein [Halobacteriales archaeon]
MAQQSLTDDPLVGLYARYVGEPESRESVYGYWIFIVGYLVSLAGIAVFLGGPASTSTDAFFYREIAIVMAAVGLPIALLGIVLMLPVRRRGIQIAILGSIASIVAIGVFTTIYPDQWAIGDATSTLIIGVYAAGVGSIAGMAVLVPIITGERSVLGETAEVEAADEQPPIILGDTLHGASFAVFHDGDRWTWRLIEEEAVADTDDRYQSRIETEDRVDHVKDQIELAGMLDMEGAAFRLYETDESRWRWTLMGEDGAMIADGGDKYAERDAAEESVSMLKEYGPAAEPLAIDGAAFDYYPDGDRWRWRLLDERRNTIAAGPGAYDDREDATTVTEQVRATVATAGVLSIDHFGVELYETTDEEAATEWHWRLLDVDDTEIAEGAGAYESRNAVETAVYDILETVDSAPVIEAGEPVYEITPRQTGEWYWRLIDAGTDMVAQSHENTTDRHGAEQSATRLKSNAADADIIQIEDIDFEVFSTAEGWQWRAVDADRNNIAKGPGPYDSREAAEEAVERTREQAPQADLLEFEKAAFQIYEARAGEDESEWRWRLIDEDGEVLADSGEDFFSREEATQSMFTLKEYAPDAELLEIDTAAFELYQEDDNTWRWRLIDEDGELIARAGDSHPSRQAAKLSMDRLVEDGPSADQRTMEAAAFQVYADDGDWRWRFLLSDGSIVADGTSTHATRDQTVAAIEDLRAEAAQGTIKTFDNLAIVVMETDGKFRWQIVDRDRSPLATSSLVYSDRGRVEQVVDAFQTHAAETVVFDIEGTVFRLRQEDDGWHWALIDESRTALMEAADRYDDEQTARQVIDQVRRLAPEADAVDFEEAAFELFEDDAGWRWRLIDDRERTIAEGIEGHDSREAALSVVERIRTIVGGASIIEIDTATFELHRAESGWRWRLVNEHGDAIGQSLPTYPTRKEARESMQTVKEYGPEAQTLVAEYE